MSGLPWNAAQCNAMAPCCDSAITGKPRPSIALTVARLLLRGPHRRPGEAFPDARSMICGSSAKTAFARASLLPQSAKKSIERAGPLQQQFRDFSMAALAGDVECRDVEAEHPLIDMPAVWRRIDHRKPVLVDSHGNRAWIRIETVPHQVDIAECGCERQVRASAVCDQKRSTSG
jgi:hypothetical protein